MQLALEKIEGQALDWLHTKPDLMTLGIDHFMHTLLAEFSKEKFGTKVVQSFHTVATPSAPQKLDVCSEELLGYIRIFPQMNDVEFQFDHMRLEQPPSYETVLKETAPFIMSVTEPTAPPVKTLGLDKEKNSEKAKERKFYNKRHRVTPSTLPSTVNPSPVVPNSNNDKQKQQATVTGARPKVICEICHKAGHEANKCLLKAAKESPVSEQTTPVSGLKCNYCKAEGHLIKDCEKIPRCYKCGEKNHKIKDCPLLKPHFNENPFETDPKAISKIESKVEPPKTRTTFNTVNLPKFPATPVVNTERSLTIEAGYCMRCSTIGHHTVECPRKQPLRRKPRCYRCNSEWHKIHECTYSRSAQKDNVSECNVM